MRPRVAFDSAMLRAEHLLKLYELLHDHRQRGVRKDWAKKFNTLMHWNASEKITRIDGKGKTSVLIIREAAGVDRQQFAHDFVCELLRSGLVASVSALDRYIHDCVVERSWKLLNRPEASIPTELKKMSLPVLETRRALDRLRRAPKSRPGNLIKKAIQDHLHLEHTFQNPDTIGHAAKMLGVKDFWSDVAKEMGTGSKAQVISTLREISRRRNQIVHEADILRSTRPKKPLLRQLTESDAKRWITWIRSLGEAIDRVFAKAA